MSASANAARRRELTLTRVFDAPRELVFRAWTDPAHLAKWWGPKMFTNPVCEVDLRVGGALVIVMRAPDGTEHTMKGEFRAIVKPEKIAFINNAFDANGVQHIEGFTTVLFTEEGRKTKLTLQTEGTGLTEFSAMMLAGMEMGWSQSLERLGEYVGGMA